MHFLCLWQDILFCIGSKHFSQDVMEKLVLVLANLFGRKYLPAKFQDATLKFYQSKVKFMILITLNNKDNLTDPTINDSTAEFC